MPTQNGELTKKQRRELRLPLVAALREEGLTISAIAERVGAPRTTVQGDLERLRGKKPEGKRFVADTERRRAMADSVARKMSGGLGAIEAYCCGLENLRLERALACSSEEELAAWNRDLTQSIRRLGQLKRMLKEAAANADVSVHRQADRS